MGNIPLFTFDRSNRANIENILRNMQARDLTTLNYSGYVSLVRKWSYMLLGYDLIDPGDTNSLRSSISMELNENKVYKQTEREAAFRTKYRQEVYDKEGVPIIDNDLVRGFMEVYDRLRLTFELDRSQMSKDISVKMYSELASESLSEAIADFRPTDTPMDIISRLEVVHNDYVFEVLQRHFLRSPRYAAMTAAYLFMYEMMLKQRSLLGADDLIFMLRMYRAGGMDSSPNLDGNYPLTFSLAKYDVGLVSITQEDLETLIPRSMKSSDRESLIAKTLKHQALLPPVIQYFIYNLVVTRQALMERKTNRLNSKATVTMLSEPLSRWSTEMTFSEVDRSMRQNLSPRQIDLARLGSGRGITTVISEMRSFTNAFRRATARPVASFEPFSLDMLYTGSRSGSRSLKGIPGAFWSVFHAMEDDLNFEINWFREGNYEVILDPMMLSGSWYQLLEREVPVLYELGYGIDNASVLTLNSTSFFDNYFERMVRDLMPSKDSSSRIGFRSRNNPYTPTFIAYSNSLKP